MTNLKRWDELQEFLPPLASYEYHALEDSIKKNGVMQTILALPDGRIIDGWHRFSIDNKAPFKILDGIDEETAFSLGIALNLARRQMSPEQIKDLQERLKQEKERQKKVALELRHAGKSQVEVAAILGVDQSTISDWQQGIPIMDSHIMNNLPDLRISIPKTEYPKIYERVETGESQTSVAADYKVTQPTISKVIKRTKKTKKKLTAKEQSNCELLCGDFMSDEIASKLSDCSIDLIFTDPPYGIEYENTWHGLADLASRALKPGGFLLTYFGQSNILRLIEQLNQHLDYFWLTCIELGGGNRQIFSVKALNQWKPLLMYYKPPLKLPEQWWLDRIKQRPEKFFHEWQQDADVAAYFIRMFSEPRALVLDPMVGTGTTAIACLQEGRDCIAIDIDSKNIEIAQRRLNETTR